MRFFQTTVLLALALNALLGLLVYLLNPSRRPNRFFFLTSLTIANWLFTQFIGAGTRDPDMLLFWIRQASLSATLIPAAFDGIRLSIHYPDLSRRRVLRTMWPWILMISGMAVLCYTDYFVYDLYISATGFAHPVYGPGHLLYIAYWVFALMLLVWRFTHSLKRTEGITHTELGFILLAVASSIAVGVAINHALPLLLGTDLDMVQVMPFLTTLLAMGIMAYGIATRRIMSVGAVVQEIMAYATLAGILSLLYLLVLYSSRYILRQVDLPVDPLASLLATLVVAFSIVPIQARMRMLAGRLINPSQPFSLADALHRAHAAALDLGTRDETISRFGRIIMDACNVEQLWLLEISKGAYHLAFAAPWPETAPPSWPVSHACVQMLAEEQTPISRDLLLRRRPSKKTRQVAEALETFPASVAIGIYDKRRLSGILLLGPRKAGGFFTSAMLDALQMISDQLAVALDNTRLYTQVQNARIYNEILLNSLSSGIIAIDVEGSITVSNREASRILGSSEDGMIGCDYKDLPEPLSNSLKTTLESGHGLLDEAVTLERGADSALPLRVSSSLFHSHTGEKLGALLVFQDISLLRQLEEQVRRTDRLSSLGTLSAGMAHEIKNPLVTIKTFTQLLPERYTDPEFRETFFDMVGQEVERIDAIVNRLLNFARPAPAALQPISLHAVLERSLKLIEQPLRSGAIRLQTHFGAGRDRIHGDHDLLIQALINFYLNALQAMPGEGTLEVSTREAAARTHAEGGAGARLCLRIRDTGTGIADEDLPKIFDPFFSRSANGTGLGLSIAHGIIQEHKGSITVRSLHGRGTVFEIFLPLLEEPAE